MAGHASSFNKASPCGSAHGNQLGIPGSKRPRSVLARGQIQVGRKTACAGWMVLTPSLLHSPVTLCSACDSAAEYVVENYFADRIATLGFPQAARQNAVHAHPTEPVHFF